MNELCNIYDGTHQTPNYKDSGIMFLSVENIKDLISNKYISYEDFKKNFKVYPEKNDILMTRIGDIGTTNIVKKNSLKAYYVSLALLKCRSINPYYLNFAIKSDYVQNGLKLRSLLTAIPMKINKDQIGEVDINYPIDSEEQSNIGKLFDNLDNLITLHHRKYTYIFYSWEQRKLDKLLEQYTEVTTINNQYPALTSSRKGIFFQTEYFAGNQIASQNNVGYNIVPRNYFTYRHMSDDEIFHFNINDICDFGIVSTLYPVFTTKKELDSKYLQYQFNYGKEFAKFASLQKQGGSRTYMYFAKLKELVLTMPKVEEQTKISSILSNIDNLITLHQHKELKRRNDNNEHL